MSPPFPAPGKVTLATALLDVSAAVKAKTYAKSIATSVGYSNGRRALAMGAR
jgi:hypothetical protein